MKWFWNWWYGKCWYCKTQLEDKPVKVKLRCATEVTLNVCNDCAEFFVHRALDEHDPI